MPDSRPLAKSFERSESPYRVVQKGSLYNILGPEGRVFTKYKSASVVGPRWEELTHTPWPYPSSAYERGLRLWELGLIEREQVGQRNIVLKSRKAAKPGNGAQKLPVSIVSVNVLSLPAPRINLDEHNRLMRALRRNPVLLFEADIRQALRHEVEYHRPDAAWAKHLLKLLARYDRRQRQRLAEPDSQTVLDRHLAWQKQQAFASTH